ncbi:MAG: heme-binding protein [Gammaproteobacteria bacterium]|nr:heme-binding protein [Gammaproteobacteria bacterium]
MLLLPVSAWADTAMPDVITVKKMSMELAAEIATKAVTTCRNQGYQVTAVVVDRSGYPQVMMRDVHASRFTAQIAEDKANAVILGGVSSGEVRNNREDIRQELNHVNGILIMQGGLPIRAAGSIIGAVGVSGAPGGDKDEVCAQKALDSVQERLDFVE